MQVKTISLVAIALWLTRAVDASTLAARVTPVPDAALAHVLIKPLLDSTLCVTGNSTVADILSSCNGDSSQIWTVNPVSGNIVQFQNAANNLCLAIFGSSSTAVISDGICWDSTYSDPYSNTEWDASQSITQAKLPLVVTGFVSYAGFANTGLCLDRSGSSSLTYKSCNGGLTQSWFLYAA